MPNPAPQDPIQRMTVGELRAEVGRLRGQITGMAFHGCLTGDCPHTHANDCLITMYEHFCEIEKEAHEAIDAAREVEDG